MKKCEACGTQMREDARFCPLCGLEQSVAQNTTKELNAIEEERKDALSARILAYGIMSLVFSCTFVLSLVGVICGICAKSSVAVYKSYYGAVEYRSRVGRDLSTAGIIVGAPLCLLLALVLFS